MRGRYTNPQGQSGANRLDLLLDISWPQSREFLVNQAIGTGKHILEIGCGVGAITEKLLVLTGKTGSVTGIDIDPESIFICKETLEHYPHAIFHTMDVETCINFDSSQRYDVIYCRFILMHLKDPLALMQKLTALLAPKGQLIVEDVNHAEQSCYPANHAFLSFKVAVHQLFKRKGCQTMLADDLIDYYRQCDLSICGLDAYRINSSPSVKQFWLQTIKGRKAALLEEKIISEKTYDALFTSLVDFLDHPHNQLFLSNHIMIAGERER